MAGGQRHEPVALPPGNDPVPIVQENGWGPGPVWTDREDLASTEIWSPDREAGSESLYRLSYHVNARKLLMFRSEHLKSSTVQIKGRVSSIFEWDCPRSFRVKEKRHTWKKMSIKEFWKITVVTSTVVYKVNVLRIRTALILLLWFPLTVIYPVRSFRKIRIKNCTGNSIGQTRPNNFVILAIE